MRWKGRKGSSNIEDRRGQGGGRMPNIGGGGGGGGNIIIMLLGLLFGRGKMSMGKLMLLAVVGLGLWWYMSGGMQGGQQVRVDTEQGTKQEAEINDELGQFVSVVLKETEDVWNQLFPQEFNRRYREPTLVLFSDAVRSACGNASAATGPFYCPADEKLYIDLSFYNDLKNRFGAPGDFAMAYVVAHEVAHHVQRLLGFTDKVNAARGRVSKTEYNRLSVMLELQADFFAGVWAHHTKNKGLLEAGDIEEALRAANAIGDDRLQKQAQGYVVPESFTHGTSEQRMRWFKKGFDTGDVNQGDTFNAPYL